MVGPDGKKGTRRAPRTQRGSNDLQATPSDCGGYEVSLADARSDSRGDAQAKGDDATRGNSSPRTRRTLPQCGQRAGSAGSMPMAAAAGDASFANSNFRA